MMVNIKSYSQNDLDGIMMGKNLYCLGGMVAHSQWKEYWEGTNLRINENLGNVRTTMVGPMGSLGITKNLNILFALPYVQTKATAGQLKGFRGMQDLNVWAKYRLIKRKKSNQGLSIFAIGGISTPTQNYVKDYLPLSIGLGSTNLIIRGMIDYQFKGLFATASSSFIHRSNIEIDRHVYYTDRMIYSNRVQMPNVIQNNYRMGFRNKEVVLEMIVDQWITQGGFDITKNNMPFPSNRMNQARVGFNGKYEPQKWKGLSLTAAFYQTREGRNVGKLTAFQAGLFYILNVNKSKKN
jgi:hypothetical protein